MVGSHLEVASAQPDMRPNTLMATDVEASVKIIRLIEKLEDLDDVQQVYSNLELSDEVLAHV